MQHKLDPIDRPRNRHVDAFVVFHLGYLLVQHLDQRRLQRQQLIGVPPIPVLNLKRKKKLKLYPKNQFEIKINIYRIGYKRH